MKESVLIASAKLKEFSPLIEKLKQDRLEVHTAQNGKISQSSLAQHDIGLIYLDIELMEYSCFEIINFIKFKNLPVKILLFSNSKPLAEEILGNNYDLNRMGIDELVIVNGSVEKNYQDINKYFNAQSWQKVESNNEAFEPEELKILDDQFTKIETKNMLLSGPCIFDLYLRIERNKYLKVFKQGEKISKKKMLMLKETHDVSILFFKTSDRAKYINYMNSLAKSSLSKKSNTSDKKMKIIHETSDKFVDELFLKGMNTTVLEEGEKLCQNTFNFITNTGEIRKLLKEYDYTDNKKDSRMHLMAIYVGVICHQLRWVTARTAQKIMLGAYLHDIGKLKLDKKIRDKPLSELSAVELTEYKKHPIYGVELLDGLPGINEQIIQMVYQHHELSDGTGYPNGLHGIKIYPPAKIIAFADFMADKTLELQKSPLEVLRTFVGNKEELLKFDPEVVRAYIKGFINGK